MNTTRTAATAHETTGYVCVGGGGLFAGEIVSRRFGRLTVRMSVACRYFGPAGTLVTIGAASWLPASKF